MKSIRFSVILILSLMMVGWGTPVFTPGDLNRDGSVDLRDAVSAVRALEGGAGRPISGFSREFKDLVRSIRAAAGLETVIAQADDSASSSHRFSAAIPVDFTPYEIQRVPCDTITTFDTPFISMTFQPPHPPPRSGAS